MPTELPEIVLLPGLDGTGELFDRLARHLAATFRITTVRYPQDANMTYADYAAFACAAIGDRRVTLLGESFSGPVAVMTAARLPQQIEALILSATFLRSPWPPWLVRACARFDARRAPVWLRDVGLMGRFSDAELSAMIATLIERLPGGLRAARLRAVADVDVRPEFSRLNCPMLVLHGDGDWIVLKSALQAAVRSKVNAEMTIIPGAHMLLQTRAQETAQKISDFVKAARSRHET